jgi:deferrochelatase/peroxidase EfeB
MHVLYPSSALWTNWEISSKTCFCVAFGPKTWNKNYEKQKTRMKKENKRMKEYWEQEKKKKKKKENREEG